MISICIATCGQARWRALAETRAIPSAEAQGVEVVVEHQPDGDVASARNAAARRATGKYVVFLDADDELDAGYVREMEKAIVEVPTLYVPRVSYVNGRRRQMPKYWPEVSLRDGNWLVIGTMLEREAFLGSGGFAPWVELYEDWHLFARMWRDGAQLVRVPEAIYVAYVTNGSRNRNHEQAFRHYWHQKIGHDVFPDRYQAPTAIEDGRKALFPLSLRFND
jgi:glycosyltransferase involved in cell wall biosynthesis